MKRLTHLTLAFITTSLFCGLSHAEDLVGTFSGDFAVVNGNATYTIPIEVAPGRGGLQPSISLNYNSAAGNGLLGIGWSISGLSSISRCGKTIAQDGVKGGVNYDENDRFCWNGQRLVPIADDSNEYRTEIDSYAKIIRQADHWQVYTKAGQVYEYGKTSNSRLRASNRSDSFANTHSWLVSSQADRHHNKIDFTYHNADQAVYIQQISYIGGQLTFSYEGRTDTQTNYHGGGVLTQRTKRLAKVESFINGNLLKDYRLSYQETGTVKTSQLVGVKQCDREGNCLNSLSFNWQQTSHSFSTGMYWNNDLGGDHWNRPEYGTSGEYSTLLDMNGDGLIDRVFDRNPVGERQGFYVMLNTGSGFSEGDHWNNDLGDDWKNRPSHNSSGKYSMLLDMNGDGLPDRVFDRNPHNNHQGMHVMLNTGDGFAAVSRWQNDLGGDHWNRPEYGTGGEYSMLLDINGDGLPDRVFDRNPSGERQGFYVMLNNGNGFDSGRHWLDDLGDDWKNRPSHYASNNNGSHSMLMDMNGDGLPDRVFDRNPYNNQWGLYVMLNTGDGFGSGSQWQSDLGDDWKNYPRHDVHGQYATLADINGDGLPDRVFDRNPSNNQQGLYVMLNTGVGFAAGSHWNNDLGDDWKNRPFYSSSGYLSMLLDINGDGLPDRVFDRNPHNNHQGMHVMLNTGSGFTEISRWQNDLGDDWKNKPKHGDHSMLADINGDGLVDRVFDRNPYNNYQGLYVMLNSGEKARIHSFVDIGQISVEYASLNQSTAYTKASTSQYPIRDLQSASYVVTQVQQSNGIGGFNTTEYSYSGLKANLQGRGSLGFESITSHQLESGKKTVTHYHQGFPLTGMVKSYKEYLGDTLVNRSHSTYITSTGANSTIKQVHPSQQQQSSYELDGSLVNQVTSDYSDYDSYGNLGQLVTTTVAYNGNQSETYSQTTVNHYDNHSGNWILGRLTDSSVTHSRSGADDITRSSAFTYHPNGSLQTETTQPGHELSLTTQYQYDQYGNTTRVTTSAQGETDRHNTTVYDSQGIWPLSKTNTLGHTERYSYNNYGNIIALTGPNGLTTHWEYDTLGRKVLETRADGSTTTTSYDWDSSLPHATMGITKQSSGQSPVVVISDTLGRQLRKITTGFDGREIYQDTQYDRFSRVTRQSQPYFTDKTRYWIEFSYDDLGRKIGTTDRAANTATSTHYNGLTTVHTNAKGQTRTTINNVYGKPAQVTDALGGTVQYRYNALGTLVETIDAEGHSIVLEHDNFGNKIAMTDPNLGHWTYAYNAYGQLIRQTDAKGQTTSITYDALGRKITRSSADGISRWVYDRQHMAVGKPISLTTYNDSGQILHRKSYNYDHLGRSWQVISKIGGQPQMIVSNNYDSHSRLSQRTYPNNHQLDYHYNQYGHLTKITSPNGLSVDGYSIAHLQEIATQALDIAAQLLDNSINWSQQASLYYYQAVNYQQADPSLERSAAELDQLAEQALAQAETYLHYAENPEQLASRLHSNSTVYDALSEDADNITYWQALEYDALGRNSQYLYGNGLVSDHNYNAAGQLTEINTGFGFDGPIRQFTYQYDANNNITNRSDQLKDIHESFGYDALDRLTSAQSSAADMLIGKLTTDISHWDNRIAQVQQMIDQLEDQQQLQSSRLASTQTQLRATRNDYQALQNINTQLEQVNRNISDQQQQINHLRGQRDHHRHQAHHHHNAVQWWNWWAWGWHWGWAWHHEGQANDYQGQLDAAQQKQNNHYAQRDNLNSQKDNYQSENHYSNTISQLDSQKQTQETQLAATQITLQTKQLAYNRYQAQQTQFSQQQQNYQQQIDGAEDQLASTSLLTPVQAYSYSASGNILSYNSQDYSYHSDKPYALATAKGNSYVYDANGNLTLKTDAQGNVTEVAYTATNKPRQFKNATTTTDFYYDGDNRRYRKTTSKNGQQTTVHYMGKGYEKHTAADGSITHKYHIYAGNKLVATHISTDNGATNQVRYLHRDNLDSVDTITDGQGEIVHQQAFSLFGVKFSANWLELDISRDSANPYTTRGFTGHEHIEEFNLIHMNGRVYDPEVGRFLSADPFIQAPYNTQNYNRYSYVLNNPLKYVDPSGYFFKWIKKNIKAIVTVVVVVAVGVATAGIGSAALTGALGSTWGGIASAAVSGAIAGAAGGATGAALNGGNLGDIFQAAAMGALVGGITAGAFHGAGNFAQAAAKYGKEAYYATKMATHGIVGGLRNVAMGGKFGQGFVSSAFVAGTSGWVGGVDASSPGVNLGRTAASAVIGGTASALGGGKFANGAISGAFARMYNDGMHAQKSDGYFKRLGKALSNIGQYGKDADYLESQGDLDAHPRYAHKWGDELSAPVTAGVLRTAGEVGQFFLYTGKNMVHALTAGLANVGTRYNTLHKNYFVDSYYDVAITVSGASGSSFEHANTNYNCRCNYPIGD